MSKSLPAVDVVLVGGGWTGSVIGKELAADGYIFATPENLAAIHFALSQHACNLCVLVLKHFTQQKDRALHRCQPLQQHQECHRQRLIHSQKRQSIFPVIRHQRLRHPKRLRHEAPGGVGHGKG